MRKLRLLSWILVGNPKCMFWKQAFSFLFFSFLEDHKQNGQDKDSSITRLWSHFQTNAWPRDLTPGGQGQGREGSGQWGRVCFLCPACGSGLSSSFFNWPIFSFEETEKGKKNVNLRFTENNTSVLFPFFNLPRVYLLPSLGSLL